MDLTFKIKPHTLQEILSDGKVILLCGFQVSWSDGITKWFPSKAKAKEYVNDRILTSFGL